MGCCHTDRWAAQCDGMIGWNAPLGMRCCPGENPGGRSFRCMGFWRRAPPEAGPRGRSVRACIGAWGFASPGAMPATARDRPFDSWRLPVQVHGVLAPARRPAVCPCGWVRPATKQARKSRHRCTPTYADWTRAAASARLARTGSTIPAVNDHDGFRPIGVHRWLHLLASPHAAPSRPGGRGMARVWVRARRSSWRTRFSP
jgi:hypothetical protein